MGIFDKLRAILGGSPTGAVSGDARDATPGAAPVVMRGATSDANAQPLPFDSIGRGPEELAQRLAVPLALLQQVEVGYGTFQTPKRTGGMRTIMAPHPALKALQRRIARRLLARLPVHPAAMGFVRGASIVSHASLHVGCAVVVRMDVRDFFPSIYATRIDAYFRHIGWNAPAADLLTRLCTYQGRLPQGAPTSPVLSNLVNYRLDARLTAMAAHAGLTMAQRKATAGQPADAEVGVHYSRYADDLTFSIDIDDHDTVEHVIQLTQKIVGEESYKLHTKKKLRIMRRHDQQVVTGLVVNERVNLPRQTRRRLRAVEHHLSKGTPASMTPAQFKGWQALEHMVRGGAA